jgi:hypothetical protein
VSCLSRLAGRILAIAPPRPRQKLHTVRFRRLVWNLRRLVELSEDATEKLSGEWILDRSYAASFVGRTLDGARAVVFDSAVLTGSPSADLHAHLDEVRASLARLMVGKPPAAAEGPGVVPETEEGGPAQPGEAEYRLLRTAIRWLALAADPTARGPSPRLLDVVREAHERALRSFHELHFESWGRRAGRPLVGTVFPGSVRLVDAGGGAAPPGESEWHRRQAWERVRSAPLRALLGSEPVRGASPSRTREWRLATLAVVTAEQATVHVAGPQATVLVDACLGDHAAANVVYCALRGDGPSLENSLRPIVVEEGFRLLDLGSGLTAWLEGRGHRDSRRVLRRLGSALQGSAGAAAPGAASAKGT